MRSFFLFGDSHAGVLLRTAKSMDLDFAGGSIMAGLHMNDMFFEVRDGRFRMLTEMGRERLATRFNEAGLQGDLLALDMPFLCTLGFNTHNFVGSFAESNFAIQGSKGKWFVSSACFAAMVSGLRRGCFAFYAALREAGKDVYAVRSPQRFDARQEPVWKAYEDVVVARLTAMGVNIVDVRSETTDARGVLRPEFASPESDDKVHANADYARIVLERFDAMLSSSPMRAKTPVQSPAVV
ncbi:MAG: hypothetical protein JOZ72_09575 [Alphaproteobacteria bacterium]|nr:hypothetical protein [Alphaproteobacteria bacterium]